MTNIITCENRVTSEEILIKFKYFI